MRRLRLTAAVLVATSLVLAGCGGDDEPSEDSPEAQEIEGGSTLDSTWPLTGLPVEGDDSSAQTYPVMVTKIDNTASSSPQIGLGEADMVVEELVEGGLTRLAVFYYSQLPDKVGPVRSMRASDIGIVSPVNGSVVTSGAAGQTIARIKHAGITFFQEGAKGVYRDTDRSAPYNVFADLEEIGSEIDQDERRPDDYLQWGEAADLPKGQKATNIGASFGGHVTNWQFKGGTYDNLNSYAADGDEFKADTVLVLRVPIGDAGYTDPAGNPVPETKLEGKGDALIFHNGRMVRATWSKNGLEGQLNLSTKAGKISVPAGHTWLELVPAGSQGNVTFK